MNRRDALKLSTATVLGALRSDYVAFDKLAFSPEFQARLKAERDAAK